MKQLIKKLLREGLEEARSVKGNISKDENIGKLLTHIYDNYGFDNTYVSFRNSEHVGKINPDNNINTTPTGLYTYDLSKYIDKPIYDLGEFRTKFPFASDREYIQFLITKDDLNIIDSNYDKVMLDNYVNDVRKQFRNIGSINTLCERWFNDTHHSKAKNLIHRFWLFIYDVTPYAYPNSSRNNSFSVICRGLGIDGFDDDKCEGWIHPSEKCQTVFFRSNIFKDEFMLTKSPHEEGWFFNNNKERDIDGNEKRKSDDEIIKAMSQHNIEPTKSFDDLIPYLNNPKIKSYISNFISSLNIKGMFKLVGNTRNIELAFDLLPDNGEEFMSNLSVDNMKKLITYSIEPDKIKSLLRKYGNNV